MLNLINFCIAFFLKLYLFRKEYSIILNYQILISSLFFESMIWLFINDTYDKILIVVSIKSRFL